MASPEIDTGYRLSHLEKGAEYHEKFENNAFRRLAWRWERALLDRIVLRMPADSRKSHLDVACGTGRILGHLERRFMRSVGIDISPRMLEVAKTTVRDAVLIRGDFTDPRALADQQFDLVTAFRFFANAEPDLRVEAVQRIAALLEPDGMAIVNNHKNCFSMQYRLSRAKSCLLRRRHAETPCMSTVELIATFARCGLALKAIYSWGVLPGNEMRMFIPERFYFGAESLLSAHGIGRQRALYHVCVFRKSGAE